LATKISSLVEMATRTYKVGSFLFFIWKG